MWGFTPTNYEFSAPSTHHEAIESALETNSKEVWDYIMGLKEKYSSLDLN